MSRFTRFTGAYFIGKVWPAPAWDDDGPHTTLHISREGFELELLLRVDGTERAQELQVVAHMLEHLTGAPPNPADVARFGLAHQVCGRYDREELDQFCGQRELALEGL